MFKPMNQKCKITYKGFRFALIMTVGLLVGCVDDDTPMQPGNSTIYVVNSTQSTIQASYQTQTWDVIWPNSDESHEVHKDISPQQEADLWVHFNNRLGTSRIKVTKDGIRKNYDVGYANQTLTIHEEDFVSDEGT